MSKHPEIVDGYDGSLADLAKAIGGMRYEQVALFIQAFSDDILRQAYADLERGRPQLAESLYASAEALNLAKEKMDEVWEICKPFMKKSD